jgi:hypothetical protein
MVRKAAAHPLSALGLHGFVGEGRTDEGNAASGASSRMAMLEFRVMG